MDLKEKVRKFNQRWNVIGDSKSHSEELKNFKTRIKNIFTDHLDIVITVKSKDLCCQYFGISCNSNYDLNWYFRDLGEEIEIYKFLEIFFSLDFNIGKWKWQNGKDLTSEEVKGAYFGKLVEALSFSKLNVNVIKVEDEIIFYPKGEELLDDTLVNNVLTFLSGGANEHFQSALNFYLSNEWIKVGERIRRSLEEFLRQKLNNSKGLEQNIKELIPILKNTKVPNQTKTIIYQTLTYLDDYFNDHTKHNDGNLDEYDAEFLIYQAGLLMRYISRAI